MVGVKATNSGRTTMCAQLDTYGFALNGLTEREEAQRELSLRRSVSDNALWERKLSGRRLKERVRRGIPADLRPRVWMSLSGAGRYRDAAPPGTYARLVDEIPETGSPIDVETYRLFHQNLGMAGLSTVMRILAATRRRCAMDATPAGLPSIVAFLVVVMGEDKEEDVFWLLAALLHKLYDNASSEFGFWCHLQERVLQELLRKKNPALSENIEKFSSLQSLCEGWFSTLFVQTFPSETVARIWDCLFCEGSKILHRIALVLLARNQDTILRMSHSVHLPSILTVKLRRTFDGCALLTAAFRSVGSMSSAQLAWIRQQAEQALRGEAPLLPVQRRWKRRSRTQESSPGKA